VAAVVGYFSQLVSVIDAAVAEAEAFVHMDLAVTVGEQIERGFSNCKYLLELGHSPESAVYQLLFALKSYLQQHQPADDDEADDDADGDLNRVLLSELSEAKLKELSNSSSFHLKVLRMFADTRQKRARVLFGRFPGIIREFRRQQSPGITTRLQQLPVAFSPSRKPTRKNATNSAGAESMTAADWRISLQTLMGAVDFEQPAMESKLKPGGRCVLSYGLTATALVEGYRTTTNTEVHHSDYILRWEDQLEPA